MSEMAQWFDGSVRKNFGRGNSRVQRHDHNSSNRSMHTSLRIGNVTSWRLQKGTHHLSFQRQMSLVHFSLNNSALPAQFEYIQRKVIQRFQVRAKNLWNFCINCKRLWKKRQQSVLSCLCLSTLTCYTNTLTMPNHLMHFNKKKAVLGWQKPWLHIALGMHDIGFLPISDMPIIFNSFWPIADADI